MASHISSNRGVVYKRPGVVAVEDIAIPRFEVPIGNGEKRRCEHGVIVKCVATNICGSDQHMVRGRTTAKEGLVLGHEITGEVIARGQDVEVIQVGDLVSVPFNVACGRCRCCVEGKTGVCLNVNPGRPGGAYGYVDMGPWQGGQAQYVLIPYADFNCLVIPHKDKSMDKIRDLALLSDILPTGYHGVITSGASQGSTVYIAGAGPVGLAAAAAAQLIGCAAVIVGDMNQQRLAQARSFGCYTVDLTSQNTLVEQIDKILGEPVVDCAVDCVGFEARSHTNAKEVPAQVLNDVMNVTRVGGGIGIPGLYVTEDPGAVDTSAKFGSLSIRLGTGWSKSLSFVTGQCPVMKYNRRLMNAILFDKIQIAKAVNASVISLDEAPAAYQDFDKGAAKKFIIDPHSSIPRNNSRL